MNEEYSYIFYTFFKNLQEMKEKPPWYHFEIYHMYETSIIYIAYYMILACLIYLIISKMEIVPPKQLQKSKSVVFPTKMTPKI